MFTTQISRHFLGGNGVGYTAGVNFEGKKSRATILTFCVGKSLLSCLVVFNYLVYYLLNMFIVFIFVYISNQVMIVLI